jgi:hypothetical protein
MSDIGYIGISMSGGIPFCRMVEILGPYNSEEDSVGLVLEVLRFVLPVPLIGRSILLTLR